MSPPTESLWREMPLSRAFFYIPPGVPSKGSVPIKQNLTFLSRCPVTELSVHDPPVGPVWREILRFRRLRFIHSSLSELPVKELSHETRKTTVAVHGAPRERNAYVRWVWPTSPRGSLTTLLLLRQCHAAFSMIPATLAWVDQSPVSQRV
jgi:hypothetical protein